LLVEASPPFTQQNTWTKPSHADVEVMLISNQNFHSLHTIAALAPNLPFAQSVN
jgi:hypothetical protein